MKLVLLAGTLTFANEWVQTQSINWRIPVATVLAAAATASVGKLSPGGAAGLGVMALVVAATTPFNGKSPVQAVSGLINGSPATVKTTATVMAKPATKVP